MTDDFDDDERDANQRRKEVAAARVELDRKYSSGDAQARVAEYKKFKKVYRNWLNTTFEGRQEKDAREERIDALREKWERQGK
jgi:hypothetical protein